MEANQTFHPVKELTERVTNEVIVHTSSVKKKKPKTKAKKTAKKSFNYFYTSFQDIGNNDGKRINVYGVSNCNMCLIICCNYICKFPYCCFILRLSY
jgi:hypothetical protein